MMNIAILHYTAPPVVGGVESVLAQHSRWMAADGHRVTIVAGRGENVLENVRLLPLPPADSMHPAVLRVKKQLDSGIVSTEFEELRQPSIRRWEFGNEHSFLCSECFCLS